MCGSRQKAPGIAVRGIAAAIRTAPAVQRERHAAHPIPRNDERVDFPALTWGDRKADEEIRITLAELAMVMKIEMPSPVAVMIRPSADGHAVTTQAGKGNAQRDALLAIEQQIIARGARHVSNREAHASETRRNAALGEIMLIQPIHVRLDALTAGFIRLRPDP